MNNDKPSSESSHSPTEQPGDAKPLIERLNDYARDYTNTTYHEALILEAVDQLERIHNHDELYMRYKNMSSYRDSALAERDRLLGEKSILQAKQAELVAENEKLADKLKLADRNNELLRGHRDELQSENAKQAAELEQLRSERDKMMEALEVSKKALYQIVDDARLKGVKYTAKAFGLVNGAYVKVESALSGGSK